MSFAQSVPFVTVAIPLYNKAALVKRAVDSVLSQTYRNLELVVVDDGSNDGGAEMLQSIRDARLRVIHQENLGPGAARNRGWREGSGEVAAFLDADDFWEAGFLQWAIAKLASYPIAGAAVGGYRESHGRLGLRPAEELRRGLREGVFHADQADIRSFMTALTYMLPVSTVVRREVLEKYGGFFDRERCTYGEDNFLWTQVLLNHPVYFGLEPQVTVDRSSSSLSVVRHLATRPVEPLLTHAGLILERCPGHLTALLNELLTVRALKRACTLATTGRWREARLLRAKYASLAATRTPYRMLSAFVSNPMGSCCAGVAFRILKATSNR